MTTTRRPLVLAAGVLQLALFSALLLWRVGAWWDAGWAGMTYLPEVDPGPGLEVPAGFAPFQGMVLVVVPGSPAAAAGLVPGDVVTAVGGVEVADREGLSELAAKLRRGDGVTYELATREPVTVELTSAFERPGTVLGLVVNVFLGLVFLASGTLVAVARPRSPAASVFYLTCTAGAALAFVWAASVLDAPDLGGVVPLGGGPLLWVSAGLQLVLAVVLTSLLFHLSLVFPRPRPVVTRRPSVVAWLHAVPLVPPALVASVLVALGAAGLVERSLLVVLGMAAGLATVLLWLAVVVVYSVLTCGALYRSYRDGGETEKRQLRWPLWGITAALSAALVVSLGGLVLALVLGPEKVPGLFGKVDAWTKVFSALIPVAFALALLERGLAVLETIGRTARRLLADAAEAVRGSSRQDFTTGSLGRAIFLLAVPMVLETSMHSVFAVCDTWFVARLGPAAVASVGLTEALLSVVFAIALGLSMGAAATVARRVGGKDMDGAARVTVQAILVGLAVSITIGVLGALYASDLLALMGAGDEVVETGRGYAAHIFGGAGTVLMLFLVNATFRGAGDPTLALRALALANLINIVLDPIFIFGLGPIEGMGVTGAAVATNVGRGIGVLYQVSLLVRGRGRVRVTREHLVLMPEVMKRLIRISGVAILQYSVATTSFTALVRVLAPYSAEALAGYTIAVRVIIFVLLPAWGLANAAATLTGQSLGAGRPERAERAVWLTIRANLVFLGTVELVFLFTAVPLVSVFTDVPEVVAWGAQCLRTVSWGYLAMAAGMVLTASFNGAGDTTTPTWINLGCHWLLKIPVAWILTWPLGLGPLGVFVAIPIAEVAVASSAIVAFRRGGWKHKVV